MQAPIFGAQLFKICTINMLNRFLNLSLFIEDATTRDTLSSTSLFIAELFDIKTLYQTIDISLDIAENNYVPLNGYQLGLYRHLILNSNQSN